MKIYDFRKKSGRYYYILHVTGYRKHKYDAVNRPTDFDMIFDTLDDAVEMESVLYYFHHVICGQTKIERQLNQITMEFD